MEPTKEYVSTLDPGSNPEIMDGHDERLFRFMCALEQDNAAASLTECAEYLHSFQVDFKWYTMPVDRHKFECEISFYIHTKMDCSDPSAPTLIEDYGDHVRDLLGTLGYVQVETEFYKWTKVFDVNLLARNFDDVNIQEFYRVGWQRILQLESTAHPTLSKDVIKRAYIVNMLNETFDLGYYFPQSFPINVFVTPK